MTERATARLRALLARPGCIVAPGVADALAARLVALEGFDAVYMTGFGTSLTRLGAPDVGLLTATEMVDNASRIVDASGLPVIADADTGYGNPINMRRTIRDYEKAGVAGVHIEDQVWPKRCGHLAGKRVIPTAEMAAKITAACDARSDADFMIIARCDAIAVEGLEAALERGERYREAGADMLFIEAPVGRAEVERVARTSKACRSSTTWPRAARRRTFPRMSSAGSASSSRSIRTGSSWRRYPRCRRCCAS